MNDHVASRGLGSLGLAIVTSFALGCSLIAAPDESLMDGDGGHAGHMAGGGGAGGHEHPTGGTGGTGGDGGEGGAGECEVPSDCGANACIDYACNDSACVETPVADGTPVGTQAAGDCKVMQCDGRGNAEEAADDDDVPVDGSDCTDDVCNAGTPSNPDLEAGTACGVGGVLVCDGSGSCVGCNDPTDCTGVDTECRSRTCEGGVCGVADAADGTEISMQAPGDCQVAQCDGSGNAEDVEDNEDVPFDDLECTLDLCSAGLPSNPDVGAGEPCSEGSGTMCDGSGNCVECIGAADCPGLDTECQARACTLGVCGVSFVAGGTPVSLQTNENCLERVCDGNGAIVEVADDLDLPVDENLCTNDVCTIGIPSNPAVNDGTSCGPGVTCVSGQCTGCSAPADCPGTDTECKTRTCTTGVCGFSFAPNGFIVASQMAGDCQSNVCDGSGNIQSVALGTDVLVDGNQCTSDLCANGTPSNPPAEPNTACTQGGTVCNASGQCVACNQASQCPGMDADCQFRTCTANQCGMGNAPAGTPTSMQTPGDCLVNQCNASGGVVSAQANGDVPGDEGNQCTIGVCNAGVPGQEPVAPNTACTQGGTVCNATGTCVECNQASQCPGMDTDCQTRTCMANDCGVAFTPGGTPVTAQTTGDCQEVQCNGAGGTTSAANNLDVPADDNIQCTDETCLSGVPQHPPRAANTPCTQDMGSYCDGAGDCVECNLGSQCPSMVCSLPAHTCADPTCTDNVENGTESDVDCGGACPDGCGPGEGCGVHDDCEGGACNASTDTCAPTCMDAQAPNATCTSYCACMMSACTGNFPSTAACIEACSTFNATQLCCRAYHCSVAVGDPVTHCPHALGQGGVCP